MTFYTQEMKIFKAFPMNSIRKLIMIGTNLYRKKKLLGQNAKYPL